MIDKNNDLNMRLRNFILALFCAGTGMLFINLGLQALATGSPYWWISFFNVNPVYYISIGIGMVFILTSIFFVKECFR